jgi:CHAT domain-containing protein
MLGASCHRTPNPQVLSDQIDRDMWRGDVRAAAADADRALSSYHGTDPAWSWRFRILKARILVARSAPQDALAVLNAELPSSLATGELAVRKNMVEGMAQRVAQNFDKSEQKLRYAEVLASQSQMQLLCEVLNARGALQMAQRKHQEAHATFDRALALARQYRRPDEEASALVSLAWLAVREERFDAAVEQGQVALDRSRSLDRQGLVATALGNLGYSYSELGDFESALEFYRQGAETSERLGLDGLEAYWLTGVANSSYALQEFASAEAISKRALELARHLGNMETIAECLNDLATFALETGRPDDAEAYMHEAFRLENQGLDHFGTLQLHLIEGRIEAQKKNFRGAEKSYRLVLDDANAETALRWESEARLAELHDAEGNADVAEKEFARSIATIEAARQSIEHDELKLSYLAGGIEFYDDYVDFLVAHGKTDQALQVAELSRARTLNEGLAVASKPAALLTRNLKPQQIAQKTKSILLFYWVGQKRSHLWAITPTGTSHFDLPKASDLDPAAKSYRDAVLHIHDPQDSGSSPGKQLYATLIAPAKKLLPKGSRVIVLPDASLAGLSFETLVVNDPQPHFWIDDVTVTTANSLALLAASTGRAASNNKRLMLVGDTISPNDDFPALPNAAEEIKVVEKYFPLEQREVLERSAATPTAYVRGRPERFAYLHFVTHGTASVRRPLESAVILSKEGDSYKLYAREIVKHPLTAQLVTISACEGAGKRAYSGEGLVGLSWAFLRAGAHNVVGALWEVSDSSTPQFMDTFYGELARGKDPASALRAAKLSLLHSADTQSVFRKPYYWAPFQLYAGS